MAEPLKAEPEDWDDTFDYYGLAPGFSNATAVKIKPDPSISSTDSKDGSRDGSSGDSKSDLKKQQRRAAVAAASRATRAKRKKELEDLRTTHKKLQEIKEKYLVRIAELQMQVQTKREAGAIDLTLENQLLRSELNKHKDFIAQFKSVADGVPTTSSAKRVICMQGADNAIAQLLGLLSTSMVDPSWKKGTVRTFPSIRMYYQRLPLGCTVEKAKRVTLRVDIPFIPATSSQMIKQFWKMWADADLSSRISRHFGSVSKTIKEIDTGLSSIDMSDDQDIKIYYYRENRKVPIKSNRRKSAPKRPRSSRSYARGKMVNTDTLLLITSKRAMLPLSSFPGSAKSSGMTPAHVLVNTATQHSKDIEPEQPGVNRIRSCLLEGVVLREMPGGVAFSGIFSYPLADIASGDEDKFLSEKNADGWVDSNGVLTDVCEHLFGEIIKILAEGLKLPIASVFTQAKVKEN